MKKLGNLYLYLTTLSGPRENTWVDVRVEVIVESGGDRSCPGLRSQLVVFRHCSSLHSTVYTTPHHTTSAPVKVGFSSRTAHGCY